MDGVQARSVSGSVRPNAEPRGNHTELRRVQPADGTDAGGVDAEERGLASRSLPIYWLPRHSFLGESQPGTSWGERDQASGLAARRPPLRHWTLSKLSCSEDRGRPRASNTATVAAQLQAACLEAYCLSPNKQNHLPCADVGAVLPP